jgi:hypothetical protein
MLSKVSQQSKFTSSGVYVFKANSRLNVIFGKFLINDFIPFKLYYHHVFNVGISLAER